MHPGTYRRDAIDEASPFGARFSGHGRVTWTPGMSGDGAGLSLADGWDRAGITLDELWLSYLAIGGTASRAQVANWVSSLDRPDSYQHNLIAQVLNEHFVDQGGNHPVTYHDIPSPP